MVLERERRILIEGSEITIIIKKKNISRRKRRVREREPEYQESGRLLISQNADKIWQKEMAREESIFVLLSQIRLMREGSLSRATRHPERMSK
jgi:hypothetical protein